MDAELKLSGIKDRLNDINARLDSYATNQTITEAERSKFRELADEVKRLIWKV